MNPLPPTWPIFVEPEISSEEFERRWAIFKQARGAPGPYQIGDDRVFMFATAATRGTRKTGFLMVFYGWHPAYACTMAPEEAPRVVLSRGVPPTR